MAQEKKFKRLGAAIAVLSLAAVAAFGLASCAGSSQASTTDAQSEAGDCCGSGAEAESTTITVAASPTPHAEILNDVVAPLLAKEGIELKVIEFNDYVQLNTATENKEVNANFFQHQPYLDSFNEENGTHLASVVAVHYEPFGLYAGKTASLADLPDGATVAIPNDTTNEARALLLLEQEGLIEVSDSAGIAATPNDIVSNPKNLQFVELEAALIPRSLQDVNIAAINANYAVEAGLTPSKDALALEDASGDAAKTYANVLVTKECCTNSESIQKLAAALTSQEVKDYIETHYQGAVEAIF
ncbi:MetQ/NlpA family ABC transporter substrate-binding protein [Denitrobacterium detoxificans]|jgi:D-methionine transport system substrate-binding protein|uniref:MetQ/NlpA family ABC transporter substrate-binding protein n=1 Tax=Denitrobacterium detoxificans TaxID=79604 RepID=UPI0026E97D7F|nr:MetQ/NlpA family ABC transporter substrate-binding protein [Denitrobacterium detoxificans]MBE6466693.1 ABC transporter substrate-binding protein [Denitrobacterium detoxificans]